MKTSAGMVRTERKTVFLNRVTKPHVFSKMIENHGAALKEENHLSIVPHQILHPDYDPKQPQLKVEHLSSRSSSSISSERSDISDRSKSVYSMQSLPRRPAYVPLHERQKGASSSNQSSHSESSFLTDVDLNDPTHRYTIMELEAILIREKTKLKKMQLESDASRKVYSKTRTQMNLKIIENQRRIKKLLESIKQARQNLEGIQATMPAAPAVVIRHRSNSTSSIPEIQSQPTTSMHRVGPETTRKASLAKTSTPFSHDNGTTDYI